MRSGSRLLGLRLELTGELAHRFASECESQGVMNDAVQDGIGEGWILNLLMPVWDRELGGKETGSSAIAVIEEIENVPSMVGGHLISEPFVENDQLNGGELFAKFRERAIRLGKVEFSDQVSRFDVAERMALLAEMIRQGTG